MLTLALMGVCMLRTTTSARRSVSIPVLFLPLLMRTHNETSPAGNDCCCGLTAVHGAAGLGSRGQVPASSEPPDIHAGVYWRLLHSLPAVKARFCTAQEGWMEHR